MRLFTALAFIACLFITVPCAAAEEKPAAPPTEKTDKTREKPGEKPEWKPPTDKYIEKLKKAEQKKFERHLQRKRKQLEDTGMPEGRIKRQLAEVEKKFKKNMKLRIELAQLPPNERREAIINAKLKDARVRLERQGLSGEDLEKELARMRDEISMNLDEQEKFKALPPEKRKEHLLKQRERDIRARLTQAGLAGDEFDKTLADALEKAKEEIEQSFAPKKDNKSDKKKAGKKAKLTKNELRREIAAIRKQLTNANRKMAELSKTVRKQSRELAKIRRLLEEIKDAVLGPEESDTGPGVPQPLPEPPDETEPAKPKRK